MIQRMGGVACRGLVLLGLAAAMTGCSETMYVTGYQQKDPVVDEAGAKRWTADTLRTGWAIQEFGPDMKMDLGAWCDASGHWETPTTFPTLPSP